MGIRDVINDLTRTLPSSIDATCWHENEDHAFITLEIREISQIAVQVSRMSYGDFKLISMKDFTYYDECDRHNPIPQTRWLLLFAWKYNGYDKFTSLVDNLI